MIRQNSKLLTGSESKPKNLTQSQGQTCCTIVKRNFRLLFREGGSILLYRGTLQNFSEVKSIPQESPRLEVPRVFLDETVCCLRDYVHVMKSELVFNLDEVGMSEWEDRKQKKMIVSTTMIGEPIHHGVSRSVKHISVISCVSAAGESLTPFIMTSQMSDNILKRLMSRVVRMEVDFLLRQRSKPYVSRKLFLKYIKTIFLPYLNELRDREQFECREAVLLMDNYSPHISDEIVAVLSEARVRIITFAPHTTQIFQVLDLVLSGALKTRLNGLRPLKRSNQRSPSCLGSIATSNRR
jgi:hypothetical protein